METNPFTNRCWFYWPNPSLQTDRFQRRLRFALEPEANIIRFHANSVSASEEGDYYQIWREAEDAATEAGDSHEVDGPYVIVQRDFEMPAGVSF